MDTRLNCTGERQTLKSRASRDAAEQARIKRQNEGQSAFAMRATDRNDAEAALALLRPRGRTLREAAAFLLKHLAIVKRELTVTDLATELLSSKESDGISAPVPQSLRNRLKAFTDDFPTARVKEYFHG